MSRRPSFLARLLRRSTSQEQIDRGPPGDPVTPGPRQEKFLVVAPTAGDRRGVGLARALSASGYSTTLVPRAGPPGSEGSEGGFTSRPWSLATLRSAFSNEIDRVRVVLMVVDAETIALARDLSALGARVAYDAPAPAGGPPGPLSYDAQTERALVDAVEDLVGADARAARHLSSTAGGGRIVHVVPNADDDSGWMTSAGALVDLAARPAVTVLLKTGERSEETTEAVEAFIAARSDGSYRLTVVASADDPASDRLDEIEEAGQITLLRSARPGRAAAWNLGLSATRGEYVAFVDAAQRPDGAGWLRSALEALRGARDLGAVGLSARVPPGVVGGSPRGIGAEALRVGGLETVGLVAPRAVLRRAGGLVESLEAGSLHSLDLSFRIRDLGFQLALCPALGLRGAVPSVETSREAESELRRRWSHRPRYLDGSG